MRGCIIKLIIDFLLEEFDMQRANIYLRLNM